MVDSLITLNSPPLFAISRRLPLLLILEDTKNHNSDIQGAHNTSNDAVCDDAVRRVRGQLKTQTSVYNTEKDDDAPVPDVNVAEGTTR